MPHAGVQGGDFKCLKCEKRGYYSSGMCLKCRQKECSRCKKRFTIMPTRADLGLCTRCRNLKRERERKCDFLEATPIITTRNVKSLVNKASIRGIIKRK